MEVRGVKGGKGGKKREDESVNEKNEFVCKALFLTTRGCK